MGKTASLTAGPKLVRVKSPGSCSSRAGSGWSFDWCMHVQLVWESNNFTGSSVPLIESLKSKAQLITDLQKRKNLTHLQWVSLFITCRPGGHRIGLTAKAFASVMRLCSAQLSAWPRLR